MAGEDLSLTIGCGNHTAVDSELTLQKHVSRLASSCFYRQVRNRVSQAVLKPRSHSRRTIVASVDEALNSSSTALSPLPVDSTID